MQSKNILTNNNWFKNGYAVTVDGMYHWNSTLDTATSDTLLKDDFNNFLDIKYYIATIKVMI